MERLEVRYRSALTGKPLISVTQVLTLTGRIDKTWYTPEAAERGRLVHDLTEAFDRGVVYEVRPELAGYLDAYARFLRTVKPVYVASEVTVRSEVLRLGGRIDRVCRDLLGHPAILDFKTGPPADWHGQQLAAYNALRPTGARFACYLKRDGKYALRAYDDPVDHRKFMFDLAAMNGAVTAEGDYWQVIR